MFTLRFDMRAPGWAAPGPYRIFTRDEAAAYMRGGRPLPVHPLCGGIAPNVAWRHLTLAVAAAEQARAS